MKKNNYMKIINTFHTLFIGFLFLMPLIWSVVCVMFYFNIPNSDITDLAFVKIFNNTFDYDFSLYNSILYQPFYKFFMFFGDPSGGDEFAIFFANLCSYYCFILVFEFILGLFRRIFNWIMGFVMGGDSY